MKKIFILFALGLVSTVSADFVQTVNDLIPKLASPDVPSRYAAQMELQALASPTSAAGHEAERAELATLLAGKAADDTVPQPARVWIVRQLEYMGAGEAVPALTQLMSGEDAELRECARRALQKNSAPAASASLRTALATAQDARWKIGLISALGERRDPEAVRAITSHLADSSTAVAAAIALGKIANPAAVEALWTALEQKNPAAGEALIVAATRLRTNDVEAAKAIYQKLVRAENPQATRAAALTGLARVDRSAAAELIPDALAGDQPRLRNAAVLAAPRAYRERLSESMVVLLPKLPPAAKAQVLGLLDAKAEPAVIAAVADSAPEVRLAAVENLGRLGSAAAVPALLSMSGSGVRAEQTAANLALAKIAGPEAGKAIRDAAASGEPKQRAAAMNALAARQDRAALAALLQYAEESDTAVKQAAFAALSQLGADAEIEPLGKLALAGRSAEAVNALEAVALRAKDKPAAAHTLLTLATDAPAQAQLLKALTALGGPEALGAVSKLVSNADVEVQNRAIRALGNWPDFAAAHALLEHAGEPGTTPEQKVLAIQGIARLVKSAEAVPAPERAEAALAGLKAAANDDAKRQVLSALATVPHRSAATAIKSLLDDANLKKDAGFAGVALAELLLATDKPEARGLAQAVKDAAISADLTRRADRVLRR